jgi:predicted nuclease of predicted toxin-antitoxin system
VKLLLDQNLSYRLVDALQSLCPETVHVRSVGLAGADDIAIWEFAGANGFTIVTKDSDFDQRAFLLGPPPKIVFWVQLGNCTTRDAEARLRSREQDLAAFHSDEQAALLILP